MRRNGLFNLLLDLGAIAFLVLVLLPESLSAVVDSIGVDQHPISFFIAPALYAYGGSLLPNVDFWTQYGSALSAAFHPFLTSSPRLAFENAILFTLIGTGVFVIAYYFLAKLILGSRRWALILSTFALVMNYYGSTPLRSAGSWPARYPMVPMFCLAFVGYSRAERRRRPFWILALAVLAGLSMFWVTEIGCYLIVAGGFVVLFAEPLKSQTVIDAVTFAILSVLVFVIACYLTYGFEVLHWSFFVELLRPALIYGGGFGAWPINWLAPQEFVFTTVAPLFALGTVVWGLSVARVEGERFPFAAQLLLISLLAVMMLAKFWNMSLIGVWFSNSYLSLLVLAFWFRIFVDSTSRKKVWNGVGIFAVLFFLLFFRDHRMDVDYGFWGYRRSPSLLLSFFGYRAPPNPAAIPFLRLAMNDEDVQMIKDLVPSTQRAFIFSSRDWAYLIEAQRAPGFPVTPATTTLLKSQGEKVFDRVSLIFIDTLDQKQPIWNHNSELGSYIAESVGRDFLLERTGRNLSAYRRKVSNEK